MSTRKSDLFLAVRLALADLPPAALSLFPFWNSHDVKSTTAHSSAGFNPVFHKRIVLSWNEPNVRSGENMGWVSEPAFSDSSESAST
jgi:hypothetical protein